MAPFYPPLTHSVSGSNCALVMTLAGHAALILGVGRRLCLLAGLTALAGFVTLVGLDPSVLRAAFMGSLGALALLSGRNGVSLNALACAITALVLISPALAVDFGFVLSVMATAGIVVSGRAVARILDQWLPTLLSLSVAVPLVAQLWCGPVLLLLNPDIPVCSLPANLLAGPVVPLVTVCGLLAVLVLCVPVLVTGSGEPGGWLLAWENAAHIPLWVAAYPARFVAWTAQTLASAPGSQMPWPEGYLGVFVLGCLTVVVLGALHHWCAILDRPAPDHGRIDPTSAPEPRSDSHWQNVAATRRRRRRLLALCALLALTGLVTYALITALRPAPPWDSVMCDVGQGDAILHRTGEHSAILVDAGPEPRTLKRCLKQAGITRLNAVIITHDHADHTGGLPALQDGVEVERVWYSTARDSLPRALQSWEAIAQRAHIGDQLQAGSTTITVLGAPPQPRRIPTVTSQDENNASIALHITVSGAHGPTTWLSAGDLEEDGYQTLRRNTPDPATIDTDILKVSHHGARNGGTHIIQDSTPVLAVISVGRDNSYGHPHPSILDALQENHVRAVRTDQHGSLWIRAHDGRISVATR